MANRNTRRLRKAIAQEIAKAHRDGMKVTPAPSKRRSAWRGISTLRVVITKNPGFHHHR